MYIYCTYLIYWILIEKTTIGVSHVLIKMKVIIYLIK